MVIASEISFGSVAHVETGDLGLAGEQLGKRCLELPEVIALGVGTEGRFVLVALEEAKDGPVLDVGRDPVVDDVLLRAGLLGEVSDQIECSLVAIGIDRKRRMND